MTNAIIFLDFDGVTHPAPACDNYFRKRNLEALILAIMEVDASIVITSTWRLDKTLVDLTQLLGGLSSRVIGTTPEIDDPFMRYVRQCEVEKYLKDSGQGDILWVAIDDTPAFYAPSAPVYVTNPLTGFIEQDIEPFIKVVRSLY